MHCEPSPQVVRSKWPFRVLCLLLCWLFFAAPAIDWLTPRIQRHAQIRSAVLADYRPLTVGDRKMPPSMIAAVRKAPRALVFLAAWWSTHSKMAEKAILTAIERLGTEYPSVGVQCFILEETAPACREWLASLDVPIAPVVLARTEYSSGAGTLFWLENGRVLAFRESGYGVPADSIVARTHALWPLVTQPFPAWQRERALGKGR